MASYCGLMICVGCDMCGCWECVSFVSHDPTDNPQGRETVGGTGR